MQYIEYMTDWSVLGEKPIMSPRTTNKERKREQILRAAMKVFARQGVYNFKMMDIAERAKVGKGTLYEYFSSKDALIVGVFRLIFADYDAYIGKRIKNGADPETQLKQIISASCGFFTDRRERLDVMFDLWAVSIPRRAAKPLMADMDQAYRRYTGWVAGIIDEGVAGGVFRRVDSMSVASMIMALLDGLMFQALLGVIELDPKKTSESLSRTLLDGIKK